MSNGVAQLKANIRESHLSLRRTRTERDRADAAEAIALHASALPVLRSARRIAAYASMPSEPGTAPLLEQLMGRGVVVIVPISLEDRTMAWALNEPGAVSVSALGVPEPTGPVLGPGALAECSVAIVPALAVDHAGNRLGRGAGYYDRALADFTGVVCAVVFENELVPEVPHADHDRRVDLVLTPAGVFRPERE